VLLDAMREQDAAHGPEVGEPRLDRDSYSTTSRNSCVRESATSALSNQSVRTSPFAVVRVSPSPAGSHPADRTRWPLAAWSKVD
jgi:hypothetical protein